MIELKMQEEEGTEVPGEEKESTEEEIEDFGKDIPKKEEEETIE